MGEQKPDPAGIDSISAFGAALTALKERSGRSLSQLANATADAGGGLSRSTLNGYFKGRHLPQQGVGQEFGLLLRELGISDDAQRQAWWTAVERLRRRFRNGGDSPVNPYPGLRSFDTTDTARFFGRAALTQRLLDEITAQAGQGTPVLVVGPSGAGKSSLLRAGLLPKLADAGRLPVVMVPGRSPLTELSARLAEATGTRANDAAAGWSEYAAAFGRGTGVLVVDQLEEIFAADVGDTDRHAFLAAVSAVAREAPVVLGLRADFYGPALRCPELAAASQDAQIVVGPLTGPELRAAITEPAHAVGVTVDDGLVELLVREVSPATREEPDAAHEQGALPLLSHTLQAAFDAAVARGERVLGVADYHSVGGLRHAIAETAESAYCGLGARAQQVARSVFLRLAHVGDAAVDTRRRVSRDELVGDRPDTEAEEIDDLLDTFIAHRLLTADDDTVQISHEALLRAWPRLRGWLDDDRAGRQVHRRLTLAARTWREHGRTADDLYQGSTLALALAWTAEHQDELNPLERQFLEAGVGKRDAAETAARRRVRRRYQFASAAVVLVVVAASALFYAWRTQDAAKRDGALAMSRDLAVKAERLRETDPALAAQLAAIAYQRSPTAEATSALLDSAARPLPARYLSPGDGTHVVAATTGVVATGADNGTIALSRAGQHTPVGPPLSVGSRPATVTLSTDGSLLAAVGENGTVRVWDVRDLAVPVEVKTMTGPSGSVASVAFSPDNRTVAAGGADNKIHLWHLDDPGKDAVLSGPQAAVTSVAFAPDGRTLAAGSRDRAVHRFALTDPAGPHALPALTGLGGQVFSVAISPDSRVLAAGTSSDRAVYRWDVTDPAAPQPLGKLTGPASWVTYIDFSPAGDRIVAASSDRKLWEWDLATGAVRRTLPHAGVLTTALYVDEHTILTLAEDGITRIWTVPGPVIDGFADTVFAVALAGPLLAVGPGAQDNGIHLVNAAEPGKPAPVSVLRPALGQPGKFSGPTAIDPDRHLLVAGTGDGGIHVWDIADPARPRQLTEFPVAPSTVAWVEFEPRGTGLLVATKDGTVSLLDLADPTRPIRLAAMRESEEALNDARFSPDGELLVTGSDDGNAYLYDVADLNRPRRLATLAVGDGATSAVFSPDGAILAVGAAADDNVYLWDLADPAEPKPLGGSLDGPVADLHQLAFHPGRNELAGASIDGTVWLWDLTDPREPRRTATVTASADAAMTLAYNHDGTLLATGSRDGTARLWRTDPDATLRWLCTASGAPITATEWDQFLPGTPYAPPCA
ncbi:hypothetical protein [Amycolatopsis sp. 195334CR]|uniref:nSTAND1 domain-containing NTPase n=1 Tax=Amycolatopsis sp. 195334CR TaxID=2814588 RepID=UPI001A8ECCF8|nr:hypothetical protein [Amycolatopsis sp. 195334CR]MBN6041202.1 hypothetical protein [Amycolatopsis sp. 195334CR]